MKKVTDREPFLLNSTRDESLAKTPTQPWMRYIVAGVASASIFFLIILLILLAIPITVLAIGVRYRDPRYCPIEPRISLFLIVNGSVSLVWIFLTIIITGITLIAASNRSYLITIILPIILSILLFIGMIFSFIWLIIGSVWTFNIYYWLTYYYDRKSNFYPYNYCQAELYRFTFTYIILSYILLFLQCCYYCVNNRFISTKK